MRINIIILLCLVVFVLSCERRPIYVKQVMYSIVQLNINWEHVEEKPEHLKALFYPVHGSEPLTYYIEPDRHIIKVPAGSYNVVVYNWRSNNDGQTIRFIDDLYIEKFRAFTDFINVSEFADNEIIDQPDSLYIWNYGDGNLHLVLDSCNTSYYQLGNHDDVIDFICDTIKMDVKPVSKVYTHKFFIPVNGLKYVSNIQAVISGVSPSLYLCDGKVLPHDYGMLVNVKYMSLVKSLSTTAIEPTIEGVECSFSAFGFIQGANNNLTLKFILRDGTLFEKIFDVTEEVHTGKIKDFITPIEIPFVEGEGGAFTDPSINDWDEVIENIVL